MYTGDTAAFSWKNGFPVWCVGITHVLGSIAFFIRGGRAVHLIETSCVAISHGGDAAAVATALGEYSHCLDGVKAGLNVALVLKR